MDDFFVAQNRSLLQRLVANGFAAPAPCRAVPHIVFDDNMAANPRPAVGIFWPTMLDRVGDSTTTACFRGIIDQVRDVHHDMAQPLHLFVAVQHPRDGLNAAERALNLLVRLIPKDLAADRTLFGVTAIALNGSGKIHSLNAMTSIATKKGIVAAILVDDDITLNARCLSRLIQSYRRADLPVAIGARKVGIPFDSVTSRLLHRAKKYTQPAENYPHACCLIVSLEVILPIIPDIYSSDDGYICFKLLAPESENPLERLRLQDGAWCQHKVGGSTPKVITSRIRRILLHHHLFLSHFEKEKNAFYMKNMLFYGLWPYVPFDGSKGIYAGVTKCILKYLYGIWFLKVGLELVVRGLVGRPVRDIDWGAEIREIAASEEDACDLPAFLPHNPSAAHQIEASP